MEPLAAAGVGLVRRMVMENGLEASGRELALVRWWLEQHYVLEKR